MDRSDVGFGLGAVSGVISLLEFSIFFARYVFSVRIVGYLVVWYLVAAGLSLLVLWAAFMVYRGRKVLGGTVMFATSLSFPVNFILFAIPGPIGSMIPKWYYPLPTSVWLLFSMIGGILIISIEMKQKRARAIVYSIFTGVLALYISPNTFPPGTSAFFITLGAIPFIVAVLTFVLFSVKKERNELMEETKITIPL